MTARHAFDPEPAAFDHAELLDRLTHVFRTAGVKTAGARQQRRDHFLIHPDQSDHEGLHETPRLEPLPRIFWRKVRRPLRPHTPWRRRQTGFRPQSNCPRPRVHLATLPLQAIEGLAEVGRQLLDDRLGGRSLHIQNQVVVDIPLGLVRPEDLSEPALYSVPDNRLPDFSRNCDSKTMTVEAIFEDVNHEVRTVDLPPPSVDIEILPAPMQALLAPEPPFVTHSPSTSSCLWRAFS